MFRTPNLGSSSGTHYLKSHTSYTNWHNYLHEFFTIVQIHCLKQIKVKNCGCWLLKIVLKLNNLCCFDICSTPPNRQLTPINRLVPKISHPPEFDSRTVQLVASRYADWAIPVLSSQGTLGIYKQVKKNRKQQRVGFEPTMQEFLGSKTIKMSDTETLC